MQAYLAAVAKAYPARMGPIYKNIVAEDRPSVNQLRSQIWDLRFQYWFRKIESIGPYKAQAKADFKEVRALLANPGSLTYKQIGTAGVWGVHIVGAFCLGEIFGRESIAGYPVGDWHGSPLNEDAHH